MIKKLGLILGIAFLLILPPAQLARAANVLDPACRDTSNGSDNATACKEKGKPQDPGNNSIYGKNGILTKVVTIINIMIGMASVIVMIVAGFRFILASGDSANIAKARNTIIYAIVGLLVAAFAQGIIIFVINKL